jgi:hypothetical protein
VDVAALLRAPSRALRAIDVRGCVGIAREDAAALVAEGEARVPPCLVLV